MQQNPTISSTNSESVPPELYINRELSWIEFNRRVFEQAQDARHPLLERVKFLSIFDSNLDEFIMIRVAGLKDQVAARVTTPSPTGFAAWIVNAAVGPRFSRSSTMWRSYSRILSG